MMAFADFNREDQYREIERVARFLCSAYGDDPDQLVVQMPVEMKGKGYLVMRGTPVPAWRMHFTAALHVCRDLDLRTIWANAEDSARAKGKKDE